MEVDGRMAVEQKSSICCNKHFKSFPAKSIHFDGVNFLPEEDGLCSFCADISILGDELALKNASIQNIFRLDGGAAHSRCPGSISSSTDMIPENLPTLLATNHSPINFIIRTTVLLN